MPLRSGASDMRGTPSTASLSELVYAPRMPARAWLFVPGDSEKKLAKAEALGADALILDLEDAVAAEKRPAARGLVREYLSAHRVARRSQLWVRINPLPSADALPDLAGVLAG